MEEICRLCLKDCTSSFYEIEEDCALLQQLSFCLSHQLATDKNFPKRICVSCSIQIEDIQSFRQMIIDNEQVLLHKLEELGDERTKNYLEVKIEMQNEDETNINIDNIIKVENEENSNDGDKMSENDTVNSIQIANVITLHSHIDKDIIQKMDYEEKSALEVDVNTCLMCFSIFPTRKLLLKHYMTEESSKYNELLSKIDLNELSTTKIVNDVTMYGCKKCNKECRTQKLMTTHLMNVHCEERSFACKLCGRMYISAYDIMNHSKSHGKKYYCSFKCGYSSSYAHILRNHEMYHKKMYKYKCDICGKKFQVRTWLEQHQNVHTDVRKYVCDICGAGFHMDRYLTSHKTAKHPETRANKPYTCSHCSKIFHSRNSLILHLQENDMDTDYLCDICGKVMKNLKQLKAHRRTHNVERRYVCGTCNKSFKKRYNLRLHEMTHTDIKIQCDLCEQTFAQRGGLIRHIARKHKDVTNAGNEEK
ncbi:unnamed protein product [Colias eurytheme]|nr:unnamed protein product [Colias eurytheme]